MALVFMRSVDHVIAISNAVKRAVHLCDHLPESKVTTIYYGFREEMFTAPRSAREIREELGIDGAPLAGIVARLAEQKNHQLLLQAWGEVLQHLPIARLLIVGDAPLRPQLTEITETSGRSDSVIFLGWRNDIPDLVHALDLFVLSSKYEGFGLVLLEAMAAHKPIVATRVSAIPEVIEDDKTGFLVSPTDHIELAEAILPLLHANALPNQMGNAGYHSLKTHFTVEQMTNKTHDLYLKLLTEQEGRR